MGPNYIIFYSLFITARTQKQTIKVIPCEIEKSEFWNNDFKCFNKWLNLNLISFLIKAKWTTGSSSSPEFTQNNIIRRKHISTIMSAE